MIKLTKREKFLLNIMLVALVVYVGIFLLKKPLDEEFEQAQAMVAARQSEIMTVDATIKSLEEREALKKELERKIKNSEKVIGPYLEDEEWNNRMIAFMDEHSVVAEEVTLETDEEYMESVEGVFTFKRFHCIAYGMNDNIIGLFDTIMQEPDLAILDFVIESPDGLSDEARIKVGTPAESVVEFTVLMGMSVKE